MQFAEGLSDRQAAEAVRARIDWKYALGRELTDPGFDFSVLSEFRTRLVQGASEHLLLDALLAACQDRGYLTARGRQRTDATHVLGALRLLSRLEPVAETLRAAPNAVAEAAPAWLRDRTPSEWFERYGRRIEEYRLPKGKEARREYAETVSQDGLQLLCRDWKQQQVIIDDQVRLRAPTEMPRATEQVESPDEPKARYGSTGGRRWIGYKVHLTEMYEEDRPYARSASSR
jgi:transposase